MDGQEYLNQISAAARPTKPPKAGISKIFSSIYFKIGAGAILALILIMIIGSAISGGQTSMEDRLVSLKLHIDSTMEVIDEYQGSIKSSDIRSGSASLYSVLSNTSSELETYLTDTYNYKKNSVKKTLTEDAELQKDALMNDLFEAKITGQLDRVYVGKMIYEISSITTEEAKISRSTSNSTIISIFNSSTASLDTLYDQFKNF